MASLDSPYSSSLGDAETSAPPHLGDAAEAKAATSPPPQTGKPDLGEAKPGDTDEEDAIALASARLLSGVATALQALLTLHPLDQAISQALMHLGTAAEVDQVTIFENHLNPITGEPRYSQRWVWAKTGITAPNPDLQDLSYSPFGSDWYNRLAKGQAIHCTASRFAPGIRSLMAAQNILSLLLMPIVVEGKFWGFVCFDDCRQERQWSEAERASLRAFASSFGGAITQHQATTALAASQQRLQKLATNVPGMLCQFQREIDGSLQMRYVSCRSHDLYHHSPAEIQHNPALILQLVPPEDRVQLEQALAKSAKTLAPLRWTGRINLEHSQQRWHRLEATPERLDSGGTLWNGIVTDITERRQADLERRTQTAFLQSLWDNVGYGMILIGVINGGENFRFLRSNPTMNAISPLPMHTLIGRTLTEALPPSVAKSYGDAYRRCLAQHHVIQVEEQFEVDGIEVWWMLTISPLHSQTGEIDQLIMTVNDISDRKQMERKLQDSQRLLQLVMDALPQHTFWKDRQSVYLGCNQRFAEMCGVGTPDKIVGKTDYDMVWHPREADLYRELDRQVMDSNQAARNVIEPQKYADGSQRWSETNKIPLHDADGNVIGVMGTFQDVTERIQARTALEQSEAELRQQAATLAQTLQELRQTQTQLIQTEKMSSLGQLVAGIAHEINNPVNFIYGNLSHAHTYTQDLMGLIELYHQHYPTPHADIEAEAEAIDLPFVLEDLPKLLDSMKLGADRITKIVASLRTFSRMDESETKTVDIHDGIDSTLLILQHRLKPKAERPEIQIIRHYGALPPVECLAGQLNQVFMNILANAVDALEENYHRCHKSGTAVEPPTITITTRALRSAVEILIADNGPGMPQSVQQRLFDPFFTTKPIGQGTGLGLSISYQIITEKHQGSLRCRTNPGRGTVFEIQIPA